MGEARAAGLARDRQWLRLGHWRERAAGGFESEADGPGFFLSARGKTDPEAELAATVRGLFAPEPKDPERQHPQCQFPARFAFLVRRLGIDVSRLPPRRCEKLERFWERTQARGVTLVFSSYFLDNPASAFGHTFLRLDKGGAGGRGEREELLDQGVNYAATADTGNAVLYAVKGLVGLFKGEFTALPYFYKVREYADYESRDVWEYDLALEPDEVAMLVAHVWELGSTWFDYYYLSENCSYHILGALEAAAPRLDLLSRLAPVVLPAATVQALYDNPGLVRGVRFRPSIRSQFRQRAAALDPRLHDAVEALAEDPARPSPAGLAPEAEAAVLDAAVDLYDMRHARALVEGRAGVAEARQALLARRSGVPVQSAPLTVPPPAHGGPEVGHGSARFTVGGGASSDAGPFLSLGWRAALHDLLDPPAGFSPGSQLEFLVTRLRVETRSQRLRLEDFSFVDVVSTNPLDRFDRRVSWHMRAGATTLRDGGCRGCLAGLLELGGGPAVVGGGGAVTAWLSADSELAGTPSLRGAFGSGLRLGVGPTATLRLAGARGALQASAGWRFQPWAAPDTGFALGAGGRLHLGPVSLALDWRKTPLAHEGELSLLLYR
ncbi:Lnb N-terminal periplasmic domain-containing protein [Anaeromyxobacter paludicola]|uniref:DUF4105 domain-containing protein n=1 Tax=Anaeromyxobacter paludicola TaxID=2918171 RepID=A0ABM7X8W7_9BACT|nr:DUF4105 domain-containing protein [Anaeromyxobacter paludicola]BDG08292.1 hypothetical protein AMPC_14050 [Anaeromyxobacter paludicola]